MVKPDVQFDGEAFFAPFEIADYPHITDGYLPPNVHIHIDFGRHVLRDDFTPTLPKFAGCDVYIPEAAGYSEAWEQSVRRVVRGDPKLKRRMENRPDFNPDIFESAEFDAMFDSHKPILLVDGTAKQTTSAYEDDDAVAARVAAGFRDQEEALEYMYHQDYSATYDEASRDRIMLQNLGPKIGSLIKKIPRLQVKDEVIVLMRLGAMHYPVFTQLVQNPATVSQVSAETVNFRNRLGVDGRIEEKIKQLIETNQKVSRKLLRMHAIANAVDSLFPVRAKDLLQESERMSIRNTLTEILITSGAEEALELLGRVGCGDATPADQQRLRQYLEDAKEIHSEQQQT